MPLASLAHRGTQGLHPFSHSGLALLDSVWQGNKKECCAMQCESTRSGVHLGGLPGGGSVLGETVIMYGCELNHEEG